MIYTIPFNAQYENEINKIIDVKSRLIAFKESREKQIIYFPKHVEKIICDSGAYALSQRKMKMSSQYMQKLANWYNLNTSIDEERLLVVAPDEFLNPAQSMLNFVKFKKIYKHDNLTAVLQCEKKGEVNINSLKKQVDFYVENGAENIFFSNPGLRAKQCKNLSVVFKYVKEKLPNGWLHNLGAGWDLDDVQTWQEMGCLDSIDSIAYYTTNDITEFGSLNAITNVKNIIERVNKYENL